MPCTAENLIVLLDAMPPAVAALPRRPAVDRRGRHVRRDGGGRAAERRTAAPLAGRRDQRRSGRHSAGGDPRRLPRRSAVRARRRDHRNADVDTIGPGRRVDDLACLIAHLSTVQRMTTQQAAGLTTAVDIWMPVFDARVDPRELRLRAAGVIISLATGPYRGQEPHWERETAPMLDAAAALVPSAAVMIGGSPPGADRESVRRCADEWSDRVGHSVRLGLRPGGLGRLRPGGRAGRAG